MARLPLPPGQRKEGIALDFSPVLIQALDALRGPKSRSAFVEAWLREQPNVSVWLAEQGDVSVEAPASRYEQVVDALLAFYRPGYDELYKLLSVAHRVIMRDLTGTDQEVEEQICGAMGAVWTREHARHGTKKVLHVDLESAMPAIQDYARAYYHGLFLEMCQCERAQLQSRFRSIVRGCEAVFQSRQAEKVKGIMLNENIQKVIQASIAQSRHDGDDDEDTKWMAQGAAIRYGREQGVIGDPLSREEQAAIAEAVKRVMAQEGR